MPKNPYIAVFPYLKNKKFNKKLAKDFVNCSKRDLEAAKLLYDNKYYEHSAYMLQQSVEKLVKAYSLYLGIIEENELKEINHNTPKAFLKLMENKGLSELFQAIPDMTKTNIDENKNKLSSFLQIEDEAYAMLDKDTIIKLIQDMKEIDISHIENEVTQKEKVDEAVNYIKKEMSISKEIKIDTKATINFSRGYRLLVPLSFITFSHWCFTRYPDDKLKPVHYNEKLGIVQAFDVIRENINFCISAIENFKWFD